MQNERGFVKIIRNTVKWKKKKVFIIFIATLYFLPLYQRAVLVVNKRNVTRKLETYNQFRINLNLGADWAKKGNK